MGLELVELVLVVEDRFGITISDEALSATKTVGDLVAHVVRLSGEQCTASSNCRTSRAFFRLREVLARDPLVCPIPLKPRTSVSELVPAVHRRVLWKRLRRAGIRLPPLELPGRFYWLLGILAVCCMFSILLLIAVVVNGVFTWRLVMYLVPFWVAFPALSKIAVPYHNVVPKKCSTLGDIATLLALDASVVGTLPEGDVFLELRHIIHEELDVPLEKVTTDARFIQDLRAG